MDDIFTPPDDQTTIPENAREILVGEGKKFKDDEALAKGKLEADNYIKQLQRELSEIREHQAKSQTMEEIKTQILDSLKEKTPVQPPVTPPANGQNDSVNVEELVNTLLEKKDVERRVQSNREAVSKTLQEKFGSDAQLILNQKAKELNVTLDYLAKVANESPSAFFRLVGLDAPNQSVQAVPAPRASQTAPLPQGAGVRNKAHYDKIRAQNPTEYFSQKVQMQMYKDAMSQGDSFYN